MNKSMGIFVPNAYWKLNTHITFTLTTRNKSVKIAEPDPLAISYGLWERVVSTNRPLSKP